MQIAELRELSVSELQSKLLDLRKEQFSLRLKKINDLLKQTHQIRQTRKLIAQVKTILTEKEGEARHGK